jgi:hypothetical protein
LVDAKQVHCKRPAVGVTMTWMEDEEAATEDGNEIVILTDADKRGMLAS